MAGERDGRDGCALGDPEAFTDAVEKSTGSFATVLRPDTVSKSLISSGERSEADPGSSAHTVVSIKTSSLTQVEVSAIEFRKRWLLRVVILAAIFVACLAAIGFLLRSFPPLEAAQDGYPAQSLLKLPRSLDEVRRMKTTLGLYQNEHGGRVVLCFAATYLLLQTFIIPGSLLLSILAGSLFGFYWGLILVSVVGALGASCCYGLSRLLLKDVIHMTLPKRCDWLRSEVRRHRHNLWSYVIFLRVTPMAPHWFVNVAAPIVSVPFRDFLLGTFLGFIPSAFVSVKAGSMLNSIESLNDLYDVKTIFMLCLLALISLLPVVIKWSIQKRKRTTA